jgi:AmpD protein
MHHTAVGNRKTIDESTWQKLGRNITNYLALNDDNYVSAHYTIWRDGKISMLVDPQTHEAYHAGKSSYYNQYSQSTIKDLNRYSIGIELIGDGNIMNYSSEQYLASIKLVKYLLNKFPTIHPLMITGHENVSPGRKTDPGKFFDWTRLFKGIYT